MCDTALVTISIHFMSQIELYDSMNRLSIRDFIFDYKNEKEVIDIRISSIRSD